MNRKAAIPELKPGYTVCLFELHPKSEPVIAGIPSKLKREDLLKWKKIEEIDFSGKKVFMGFSVPAKALSLMQNLRRYMEKLVTHVRDSYAEAEEQGEFWFSEDNPLPKNAVADRRPKMPWLFDQTGEYHALEIADPFFLDDRDRCGKLVEAAIIEKYHMVAMYKEVFCDGKEHQTTLELLTPGQWKLHVWISANPKPAPPEGNTAIFNIEPLHSCSGLCVGSTIADFAILTLAALPSDLNGKTCEIEITIKLDLKSIQSQLKALIDAGKNVRRDAATSFSLQRTILAHASELDPNRPLYFKMNVKECSDVPAQLQTERISYILNKFPLDNSQSEAVEMTLFHAIRGIHLIKGPPGNGKTRTIVVMMLILASLNQKVLVCAGSNTAVDSVFHAFHVALSGDPRLQKWCGLYCRFSTAAYQMATLRRAGIMGQMAPRESPISAIEEDLRDRQAEALVVERAMELYEVNPNAHKLINLLDADRKRVLDSEERKALSSSYAKILPYILSKCKVVGATLNASGEDALRASEFKPFTMLCDVAG